MQSYALLDGGSTRHVISKKLCDALDIDGEETPLTVTTLGNTSVGMRQVADVEVEGVNGVKLTLNGAIFGNIIAAEDDRPPNNADIAGITHLEGVEFPRFPE